MVQIRKKVIEEQHEGEEMTWVNSFNAILSVVDSILLLHGVEQEHSILSVNVIERK